MLNIGHIIVFLVPTAMPDGLADKLNCKLLILGWWTTNSEIVCYIPVFADEIDEGLSWGVFVR